MKTWIWWSGLYCGMAVQYAVLSWLVKTPHLGRWIPFAFWIVIAILAGGIAAWNSGYRIARKR